MDQRHVLHDVLQKLRDAGAQGDAYLQESRTLEVAVREGKLEEIQQAGIRGLGIRAIRDGKLGFVHTSDVGEEGAKHAAEKALDLARFATPREDLLIPEATGPTDGRDEGEPLGIYDPSIAERPIHEKEDWARSAESIARAHDERITKTEGAFYSEAISSVWLANTKGLFRHYRGSQVEVGVEVVASANDELQIGDASAKSRSWDGIPPAGELGRKAGDRAVKLLGGRPVPSGRYPVVFSPEAGWTVLVYVANALQGDHLSKKRSWLSGRMGETIGTGIVTIRDDGRLSGGPATIPFDGEGIDTRSVDLIAGGTVAGGLYDITAARRSGTQSTGSARRGGYAGLPEISASNLYLVPGERPPEEIVGDVGRGLWVWGMSGWWIGLDPSNADFSSAAFGVWIEEGKPAGPVARVSVAGSIEDILGGIDAIGNDLTHNHETKTPTFRVRALSVSGT
ncbi:MAG: hypothetical protein GF346_10510 [Candidatus Eisenbacteria bacterium]|nr:hypothetical protein [Candidatus Latescibacterota bacterium]MBD3302868.1 hypothetical protein [Candidatus Eisenbacteria bacterium]